MNETLKAIHSLKSTHGNFSSREISEDDLKLILEASVQAATASSCQNYSIIVIDDKAVMKEYLDYAGSKALVFCVDFTRLADLAKFLDHEYYCGGLPDFITSATDTALAAQTAAVAANSLGIDSLFTNSVHRKDLDKLYQKLKLPSKLCFPLISLILGYSTDKSQPKKGRLKGPGVIHYGEYHRLDTDELEKMTNQYDDPEMKMGFTPNESYKRYLDWFFCFWCSQFKDYTEEITAMLKKTDILK
ncbi:MAG: nitroreductase family protein [Bacillota bacterium]|nr:nitroreductase family protein [Bacillota bacterium]